MKTGIQPGDHPSPRKIGGQHNTSKRDQISPPAQERIGMNAFQLKVGPPHDRRTQTRDRHDGRDSTQQVAPAIEGQPVIGEFRPQECEPVNPNHDADDSRHDRGQGQGSIELVLGGQPAIVPLLDRPLVRFRPGSLRQASGIPRGDRAPEEEGSRPRLRSRFPQGRKRPNLQQARRRARHRVKRPAARRHRADSTRKL